MKTILCGINARFSHMNLAIRYLDAACRGVCGTIIREYTINDPVQSILWDLMTCGGDVYCFSCYIWNIDTVLKVAEGVKKALPGCTIVFGGQEVSFCAEELLQSYPFIGFIIAGEGERALPKLIECIQTAENIQEVPNLYYRIDGRTGFTFEAEPVEMDQLPDAYSRMEEGKMIYYESSRGCPFSCSFCLSSRSAKTRYRSLPKTFSDLERFMDAGAKQVKFVDRTFNADRERAYTIFQWLMEKGGRTNFHFEMAAHLLDDHTLDLLEKEPKWLFQFEIGVQSLNEDTLQAISRKQDFSRIEYAVGRLKKAGNIHLHLDLIAGLPCETEESFIETFERVFALTPDALQLGFLKLLKGSRLREEAEKYGIQYCSFAPYEVISTPGLPPQTMQRIKQVCAALDMLYNKGGLRTAVTYMAERRGSAFNFLLDFAAFTHAKGWAMHSQGRDGAAKALLEYSEIKYPADETCRDIITYDYFKTCTRLTIPPFLSDGLTEGEREIIQKHLASLIDCRGKEARKQMLACGFNTDVAAYEEGKGMMRERTYVLFDYATGERTKLKVES